MKAKLLTGLWAVVLFLVSSMVVPARAAHPAADVSASTAAPTLVDDLSVQMDGQLINTEATSTTPATSQQFGYLTYVRGLNPIFQAGSENERSALFTFFTNATTTQVTTSSIYRIIDRVGTTTIYLANTRSGDFASPESFASGTVVLTATVRQQVMVNTQDQTFSTVSINKVTAVTPFMLGDTMYQLGRVGQIFQGTFAGRLDTQQPLKGTFSGAARGAGGTPLVTRLRGGGVNEGDPNGTGSATVFLSASLGLVCFDITVSGISLPATASHIHKGAAGVAGPIVVPFTAPTNGSTSGCTTGVDPALIRDILANPSGYYVNVHNGPYPASAVRGQLG